MKKHEKFPDIFWPVWAKIWLLDLIVCQFYQRLLGQLADFVICSHDTISSLLCTYLYIYLIFDIRMIYDI